MTVLITGGAGYIGAHMALYLADAGEPVVVVDDLSHGFSRAVPEAATLIVGDAGDTALIAQIIDEHEIDAILHFAGSIVVPESIAHPLKYYANNTCKAHNLIATAVKAGIKHFVFSSTAAVYGDSTASPLSETAPLSPVSPYGTSKMMVEMMLHDIASAHDLRFAILRYFNVAGADPHGRAGQSSRAATHLIKIACQAACGRRARVDVYGTDYPTRDGTGIRDYIHVCDLVDAHGLALAHLRQGGDNLVLNCGYGRGASVLEVIETVKRIGQCDFPVRHAARRPGDASELIAAVDRIRATLSWQPRYDSLDTIVAHALDWERSLMKRDPCN